MGRWPCFWRLWLLCLARLKLRRHPTLPGKSATRGSSPTLNGVPLATNAPKNYVVTFTIYDAPTGGNIKWAENQTVTVDRGYFSVLLGHGTANGSTYWTNNLTGIFAGPTASSRYIGLTVAGLPGQSTPSEIQPRLQLLSSPYAFLAANANAIANNTGAQVLTTVGTSVGINETPSANDGLDVSGNIGIHGSSTLELGQGIAGQDPNAGKIGYESLSTFALDIVGAGTSSSNRRIKLWGEGGTSTTGPVGVEIDTPCTTLDVNGGAFFGAGSALTSSGSRTGISMFYDSADNTGQIQAYRPGIGWSNLTLNAGGGNVGVGNLSPQAKLHVTGNTYMDGYAGILNNNVLEFGRGIAGKQQDAGKIGYGTWDANTLDIVGGGTSGNQSRDQNVGRRRDDNDRRADHLWPGERAHAGCGRRHGWRQGCVQPEWHRSPKQQPNVYPRLARTPTTTLCTITAFGTDGPALVGNGGGVLGTVDRRL